MKIQLQYDFFKTDEEIALESLVESMERIKTSSDKVRKGTYASINEVKKECVDLKSRLEIIERHICAR